MQSKVLVTNKSPQNPIKDRVATDLLSDEILTKYCLLYEERFGKSITKEQALKEGLALVALVRIIAYKSEAK